MTISTKLLASGLGALFAVHVAAQQPTAPAIDRDHAKDAFAQATLKPTGKGTAAGTVVFSKIPEGLWVMVSVQGLGGAGTHGIHVHQNGDCGGTMASAAGDHWNPDAAPHGAPNAPKRHLGDLGNVEVDQSGKGIAKVVLQSQHYASANWDELVGRSVVLHAKKDDLTSQPSGDSGERIACGVVQKVEAQAAH